MAIFRQVEQSKKIKKVHAAYFKSNENGLFYIKHTNLLFHSFAFILFKICSNVFLYIFVFIHLKYILFFYTFLFRLNT